MQKPVMLFRPRSLLQLVVISFVLVLTPLGALLIQAMQALESVSMKGRLATLEIASLAKSSQSLPEIVLDMEHSARQYQVLGDPKLKGIFQVTEARFNEDLNGICKEEISENLLSLCNKLKSSTQGLIDTLNCFSVLTAISTPLCMTLVSTVESSTIPIDTSVVVSMISAKPLTVNSGFLSSATGSSTIGFGTIGSSDFLQEKNETSSKVSRVIL